MHDLDWDPIPGEYSISNTDIEVMTVKINKPIYNIFM